MFKKIAIISISSLSQIAIAANSVELHHSPLSSLSKYSFIQNIKQNSLQATVNPPQNQLLKLSQTNAHDKKIVRYQQLYKGIPVVGSEVMVTEQKNISASLVGTEPKVNGRLINEISLNTTPTLDGKSAFNIAKKNYLAQNSQAKITSETIELQIRAQDDDNLQLVYLVSFKLNESQNKFTWPFFIIDAHTGAIMNQWNNIKTFDDKGAGGNDKIKEYWYGQDNLPPLSVNKIGDICEMDDSIVKLVKLNSSWDYEYKELLSAYRYTCGDNREDKINGAFSPINDAYYFGHTIVDMYKDWYGYHALQTPQGDAMQLVMRVHFGENYDNAFWDGKTMSFGDGKDFYPLVSLDVAGHEVSHGFTEQHSGLEYHDQFGALNESFSDMAGQTARAYLLEKNPELYKKTNIVADKVTWGIGETIVKDSFGAKALRFMDNPSEDNISADCLNKTIASNAGANCKISYSQVVKIAKKYYPDDKERQQGLIVHSASGIFNKAFYLLSEKIGIKNAYQIMLLANTSYWTSTTGFKQAACGVIYAAKDLKTDEAMIKTVFDQVGVDTRSCHH